MLDTRSEVTDLLDAQTASVRLVTTLKDFLQEAEARRTRMGAVRGLYAKEPAKGFEAILDLPVSDFNSYAKTVAASAGIGKTTKLAYESTTFRGVIWFLIPYMKLAPEIAATFRTAGHQHVYLYRGRNEENCVRFPLAKQLTQYVSYDEQSIGTALCKQGNNLCPYYDNCPYIHQQEAIRNAPQQTVIIMAHNALAAKMPSPAPDLIVVDESHWRVMTEIKSIKLKQLYALAEHRPHEAAGYLAVISTIITVLKNRPRDYLRALRDAGIRGQEDLRPALEYLEQMRRDTKTISPEQSDEKIRETLQHYHYQPPVLVKVNDMLERLGRELAIKTRSIGHVLKYEEAAKILKVHIRKDPRRFIPVTTAVLLLDASANKAINEKVWGKNLQHSAISVLRQVVVHQVVGKEFSRQSILGRNSAGADCWPEEAARLRREIVDFINGLPGDVFVAATKQVLEVLRPYFAPHILSGHFSALRGRNEFQHCETAVIIGREQPSPEAVESYARALLSDARESLNLTGEYVKRPRPLPMRSGYKEELLVWMHPDNFVQAVQEQIREHENAQSLDRLRLIYAVRPKTLYNLCSVVIPGLLVDYLHTWQELLQGGNRIFKAFKRISEIAPAFPLGQTELARLFPDLWPSADAVKSDITRHGGLIWVESQIRTYYLESNLFTRATYRRYGQPGKASPAIISAAVPNPRQALEAVVGSVCSFIIISKE